MSLPTGPDPNAPSKTYKASCHCSTFTYTLKTTPLDLPSTTVMQCNCSICSRNGYLLIYVPDSDIVFDKGSIEDFKSYTFGAKPKMAHYFCSKCGASCMARSIVPGFFDGMTCVNVRMIEDVDVKDLNVKFADGKSYKQEE